MTYVIDDFEVASEKTDFSFVNSNDYVVDMECWMKDGITDDLRNE